VHDGIEHFVDKHNKKNGPDGKEVENRVGVVTIFTASNYCGKQGNTGGMIRLEKDGAEFEETIPPMLNAEGNWAKESDNKPSTPPAWLDKKVSDFFTYPGKPSYE